MVVTPLNDAHSSSAGIAAVSFLVKTVIKILLKKPKRGRFHTDNAAVLYFNAHILVSSMRSD